jgi:hypothetical protein
MCPVWNVYRDFHERVDDGFVQDLSAGRILRTRELLGGYYGNIEVVIFGSR